MITKGMVLISAEVEPWIKEKLNEYRQSRDISLSQAIRELLGTFLSLQAPKGTPIGQNNTHSINPPISDAKNKGKEDLTTSSSFLKVEK